MWAPTQPIFDKDLAELRFEPGSPNREADDTLTTTPQAFSYNYNLLVQLQFYFLNDRKGTTNAPSNLYTTTKLEFNFYIWNLCI